MFSQFILLYSWKINSKYENSNEEIVFADVTCHGMYSIERDSLCRLERESKTKTLYGR